MTTSTTTTMQQVIIGHVDSYQKSKRKDPSPILKKIHNELMELGLCKKMKRIKLNNNDGKDGKILAPNDISEEISAVILHCVDCALSCSDKVEDVERFGKILAAISNQYVCSDTVLLRLKEASIAALDRIRAQACRLAIHFHEFSSSCVEALLEQRFVDKAQVVRHAALQAAKTLLEKSSTLQKSLVWSCNHDPSWSNRSAALTSMTNLEDILPRVRDVKTQVRVQAIQKLHETVLEDWTAQQCATLLQSGLINERCNETNQAARVLVCTRWMKAAKYCPVTLLSHLQPSLNEKECETVIKVLLDADDKTLKELSAAEVGAFRRGLNTIPTNISPETLFLARFMCRDAPERLSPLIPDIPGLCELVDESLSKLTVLVEKNAETSDKNDDVKDEEELLCLCNQLFKLAPLCDLQEEGSRRHFIAKCTVLLTSLETPEEILEEALLVLRQAHHLEQDYLDNIIEIVEGLDSQENEDLVQLRIVSILSPVLESTSIISHEEHFMHHAISALTSKNAMLREAGVACLGRLALFSHECNPTLLEIMTNEEETMDIRAQAMLAVSDWTLAHNDEGTTLELQSHVSRLLVNEQTSVVAVAAEVATKLLLAGKVNNPEMIASLMCIFFDKKFEDIEDEEELEMGSIYRMDQLLCLFFPAYSMKSQDNKLLLLSAMTPMLAKVTYDSKRSGRSKRSWPIAKLVEFLYSTLQAGTEQELSHLICYELASFLIHAHDKLNVTQQRTLTKILGGADIDVENCDRKCLLKLKSLVNELCMHMTEPTSLESLETVMELLEDIPNESAEMKHEESEEKLAETLELVHLNDKENIGRSSNISQNSYLSQNSNLSQKTTRSTRSTRSTLRSSPCLTPTNY